MYAEAHTPEPAGAPVEPEPVEPVEPQERRKPGPAAFVLVYVVTMVLLAITAIAYWFPLGWGNTAVAFSVAVLKALFIILIFMELRASSRITWLVAATGFVWLGILLVLSGSDYLSRGYLHIAGK